MVERESGTVECVCVMVENVCGIVECVCVMVESVIVECVLPWWGVCVCVCVAWWRVCVCVCVAQWRECVARWRVVECVYLWVLCGLLMYMQQYHVPVQPNTHHAWRDKTAWRKHG